MSYEKKEADEEKKNRKKWWPSQAYFSPLFVTRYIYPVLDSLVSQTKWN